MANKPTALRFSDELMLELKTRQVGRFVYTSHVVTEMLERYIHMLHRARVIVSDKFSEDEIKYMLHCTSSTAFEAWSVPYLSATIEDKTNFYHHDQSFGVNGLELAAKVKALQIAEMYALVDMLETLGNQEGDNVQEGL